jgi:hypothetical protein
MTTKKRNLGSTPNLRPTITLDRILVYAIGGFAVYLGLSEVNKKLNPKTEEKKDEKKDEKPTTDVSSYTSSITFQIPPTNAFPLQAINLNNPPYDRNAQLWQTLLVSVYGGGILPRFGVDGKFGYETLKATQTVTGTSYVTRKNFIDLVNQANKSDDYIVVSKNAIAKTNPPLLVALNEGVSEELGNIPTYNIDNLA